MTEPFSPVRLELSVRAKNILAAAFPNARCTSEEEWRTALRKHSSLFSLVKIPGCGRKTAIEIANWAGMPLTRKSPEIHALKGLSVASRGRLIRSSGHAATNWTAEEWRSHGCAVLARNEKPSAFRRELRRWLGLTTPDDYTDLHEINVKIAHIKKELSHLYAVRRQKLAEMS